ncbi:phosphoglycerate mutase-like protein [Mytilinidion resinicola]|uniref:Phosphoglycerate mutase-like protein n=1 Tax=Mytilinidion resinicola TaxID=574789 RepID=A0A6A6YBI8_9PEZI|nr:phosphoglycerate mutase-like protein [Mytilinidion resinicola]KAF2805374.1 phosphoglycerate mutase-like protein [Mytilinidion resinicola]
MGKPRMIILVRHAQSEGNKNRDIHQFIPDHRVKLTAEGQNQAEEAGHRLRSMLKPDDTLQFFTSPYRRTRETTEGILRSLTSDEPTPSPFPRHKIKVFEEPRLREQDFGNFQPCSAEMERMWQERADYGHFFYRIPSGESAADAYDRVSGFNESMWRSFGEEDFPSVCVLVTHGLMTRVFLMKWYHWSVEYFEDLRNVNHCEFIVMKQSQSNGRYILQNELRTWSELKRRAGSLEKHSASTTSLTSSKGPPPPPYTSSPTIPVRRWGGCANGCNHSQIVFPRRAKRQNTADFTNNTSLPAPALPTTTPKTNDDPPIHTHTSSKPSQQEPDALPPTIAEPTPSKNPRKASTASTSTKPPETLLPPMSPNDASASADPLSTSSSDGPNTSEQEDAATAIPLTRYPPAPRDPSVLRHLHPGRDFGGSRSGAGTPGSEPTGGLSDDSDYFPNMHQHHHQQHQQQQQHHGGHHGHAKPKAEAAGKQGSRFRGQRDRERERDSAQSRERKVVMRKMSEAEWVAESGMGSGARADALGDGDEVSDDLGQVTGKPGGKEREREREKPILEEALKGCMECEEGEDGDGEEEEDGERLDESVRDGKVGAEEVERLKAVERCGFGEVY